MFNPLEDEKFRRFVYKQLDKNTEHAKYHDELFNKIILLVSTGAFGLSINFFINTEKIIVLPILLKISWAALVLTIILETCGYFLSRQSSEMSFKEINNLIGDRKKILTPEVYTDVTMAGEKNDWKIYLLNCLVIEFFIVGITFLAIFSIMQI